MRLSRRGAGSDRGAVAILTAVLIPVLILLTALAVDLGRWYVEAARVQKAADAAALGGVTYMPNNYTSAQTTAGEVSGDNGYTDSGTTACGAATLAAGTKCISTFKTGVASELGVTVSSTVRNLFGSIFGNPTTTIARTAVADYQGPAIMGSPCNTFGNEPDGGGGVSGDPTGTTIPPDPDNGGVGYATCQNRTPNFWATIEGPETDKVQGDRYSTRDCSNSTDGCSTSANPSNTEYDANGYFFVVRVEAAAVNQQVTVQLYDPAFVLQGTTCNSLPATVTESITSRSRNSSGVVTLTSNNHDFNTGDVVQVTGVGTGYNGTWQITNTTSNTFQYQSSTTGSQSNASVSGSATNIYNGMNLYVPNDAATRYARSGTSGFCTGDYFPGGGSNPMVTSFVLRNKTLTYNPLQASVISGCVKQFGSVTSGPSAASLNSVSSGTTYKGQVARLLHQWYTLCTFTPTEAGDYYLQVRTSASTSGATAETSFTPNGTTMIWNNGPNAYSENVTQTSGEGDNSFGIRAFVGTGGQPASANAAVSVAGYQRMPIFQNVSSTSVFNLLQVKPDAAGKQFYFDLFDLGDGAGGTITVLPPTDSGLADTALTGCTFKKTLASPTYTAANVGGKCAFTFNTTDTDGKVLSMIVPIPNGYNCTGSSPGGCWFRIQIARTGSPTDITTWNAAIGGNALRLVQ